MADTDSHSNPDGGPTHGPEDDRLAWLASPKKDARESILSVRVTAEQRDRIDRAAAAAGMKPSTYARSVLMDGGAHVEAWRAVYQLVLRLAEAAERGDDPAEVARRTREEFREIALTVFPEAAE